MFGIYEQLAQYDWRWSLLMIVDLRWKRKITTIGKLNMFYPSELSSSVMSPGSMGTTAAQQKVSRSLRRRQLPSEFHFRSVMAKFGSGTLMQHDPEGLHIYRWELPVHKTTRGQVGSQAAARIGSFCIKTAVSSRRRISHIQRTAGMLSLRVKRYWLSLLHDNRPVQFLYQYSTLSWAFSQ